MQRQWIGAFLKMSNCPFRWQILHNKILIHCRWNNWATFFPQAQTNMDFLSLGFVPSHHVFCFVVAHQGESDISTVWLTPCLHQPPTICRLTLCDFWSTSFPAEHAWLLLLLQMWFELRWHTDNWNRPRGTLFSKNHSIIRTRVCSAQLSFVWGYVQTSLCTNYTVATDIFISMCYFFLAESTKAEANNI